MPRNNAPAPRESVIWLNGIEIYPDVFKRRSTPICLSSAMQEKILKTILNHPQPPDRWRDLERSLHAYVSHAEFSYLKPNCGDHARLVAATRKYILELKKSLARMEGDQTPHYEWAQKAPHYAAYASAHVLLTYLRLFPARKLGPGRPHDDSLMRLVIGLAHAYWKANGKFPGKTAEGPFMRFAMACCKALAHDRRPSLRAFFYRLKRLRRSDFNKESGWRPPNRTRNSGK
jgi:hypothetical protein